MIKRLAIAISVLAFSAVAAPADEEAMSVVDHALQQAQQGPPIFSEFLLGAADFREATAQHALFDRIIDWLGENFDLPRVSEHPKVAFASAEKIAAVRYNGLAITPSDVTGSVPQPVTPERTTVAIYVDAEKTIYLPEEWTGRTPAELSVLLHETVHHIQNLGGIRHECPRAREKLAYVAQEKFLQMFGRDLLSEFEVNGFTILVRSTCAY